MELECMDMRIKTSALLHKTPPPPHKKKKNTTAAAGLQPIRSSARIFNANHPYTRARAKQASDPANVQQPPAGSTTTTQQTRTPVACGIYSTTEITERSGCLVLETCFTDSRNDHGRPTSAFPSLRAHRITQFSWKLDKRRGSLEISSSCPSCLMLLFPFLLKQPTQGPSSQAQMPRCCCSFFFPRTITTHDKNKGYFLLSMIYIYF